MHILILASFYPSAIRPQTGIFFAEQVLALHEAGHQVGVLVLPRIRETLYTWRRHLPLPPALSDESGLFPIYRMHYGWFPRIFPKTCAKLAERFGLPAYRHYEQRHGPPDVIHAHNAFYAGYLAALIKQGAQVPVVLTEHSSNHLRGRIFLKGQKEVLRVTVQAVDQVVTVSGALQPYLDQFSLQRPVQIIGNMVDPAFFSFQPPPPNDPFHFVAVGRLDSIKAFDFLIEAFAEAFKGENVILRIAGDGPERGRLQQHINERDLTAQVTLLGRLDREQVRTLYHNSHVLLSSSRIETFGLTLIEAMACGRPVVATKSGGPQTIVGVDGDYGLLVEVGDTSAFAQAMCDIRENYAQFDFEAIRQSVVERFSKEEIVAQLETLYGMLH